MKLPFIALPAAACLFLAATAFAQIETNIETITLHVTLNGATEVPSVDTKGTGTGTLTLNTATRKLTWNIEYADLSGPATDAHIHGPAEHGVNAGVVAPLIVMPSPLIGEILMDQAEVDDLLAGKDYINIHTAAHPKGEIRGYITK